MGDPNAEHCIPEMRGLTREAGIVLLDRAAEIGLLSAHGDGYYSIHPALPWFFHQQFTDHYGPSDQQAAIRAIYAYVKTIDALGSHYLDQLDTGRDEAISVLCVEEANLLHACSLSRTYG